MASERRAVRLNVMVECEADGYVIPVGQYRGEEKQLVFHSMAGRQLTPKEYWLDLKLHEIDDDSQKGPYAVTIDVTGCVKDGKILVL